MAVPTFVDRVTLHVTAGSGGNGVASVHREKFKPLGGPDGGNGGPGGSVVLRVDPDVTTLVDYHHSPHRKAEHGGHGAGGNRNGAHGDDLVLPVPDGTVVSDDQRHRARRPGRPRHRDGGRRRAAAAASATPRWPRSKRKAPGFALLGEPGDDLQRGARAQGGRRHRAGRLPERRQVQPDRRAVAGPPEDRRLPVHHAGPEPRRGHRRRHHVHRRRRARPDRGRQRGPRPRATTSCATSSAAPRWCT